MMPTRNDRSRPPAAGMTRGCGAGGAAAALAAPPGRGCGRLGGTRRRRGSLQGPAPGRQVLDPEDEPPQGYVDGEEQDRDHQEDLTDRPRGVHGRQWDTEG